MRRALTFGVSAALLLPACALAAARKRHHGGWHCRPGHSHLVVANKRAEVFEVPFGSPPRFEGCVSGSTHRYALGPAGGGAGDRSVGSNEYTLAGTTLAFAEGACSSALPFAGAQCSETLRVVDLRSGTRLHQVFVTGPQCNGTILKLVVKEDGALAWVATDVEGCPVRTETLQVHALDSAGDRLLASGTDIAPYWLTLTGSTLYWKQSGQLHAAPLN